MTDTWRSRVVLMVAASVLAITTGFVAYDIGRKDGYADAASTIARAPEALAAPGAPVAPAVVAVPAHYHRHSGWGGGFIFPLLFLFWIFLFTVRGRMGWWGMRPSGGPRGQWYEERFDEIHRRAHDRMNSKE